MILDVHFRRPQLRSLAQQTLNGKSYFVGLKSIFFELPKLCSICLNNFTAKESTNNKFKFCLF